MTALSDFVTGLSQVDIAGVNNISDTPPLSLNSSDLPMQWVQAPTVANSPMTFNRNGGWPTLTASLIVAYSPVAQATAPENWQKVLFAVDDVQESLSLLTDLVKGKLVWTARPGVITISQTDYWAVIAEVTAYG